MGAPNRSLVLLTAFARALSHKIRTPLAVVSNEIAALPSSVRKGAAVASGRIREISAILKDAVPVDPGALTFGDLELSAALKPFGSVPAADGVVVLSEKKLLYASFQLLERILRCHVVPGYRVEIEGPPGGSVTVLVAGRWDGAGMQPEFECASITEFLSVRLGLDAIEAPLVDAMLEALGISVQAVLRGEFAFRFLIPRAKEP